MANLLARNRGRWTEDDGRAAIDAWSKSGQSGAAFARSIGVGAQRLLWWRRRLGARSAGPGGDGAATFVPVAVRGAEPVVLSAPIVVTMANGVHIEVREIDEATAAWVATVVATLAGRP